ncbi:MAG: hypothetical protein R3E32_22320 [Chitinophagales bacterium]
MSKIIKTIGQIDRKCNKSDLIALAQQHASEIMASPNYDLLKVYVEFKRYEVYLKTLIWEVRGETLKRAKEEGRKDFEYASARVTQIKIRKFDYSIDEYWENLNNEIERLKALKKERETMLKAIKGDFKEVLDEETGEIIKIPAPSVEYTDSLRIKL